MSKILWLHTGGTIACNDEKEGLSPSHNSHTLMGILGGLVSEYEIFTEDLFTLDSSNIQPEEWVIMAQRITDKKDSFDGIVITHGTDTLAYSASALSFMLQNISIPVVLTGSQLPLMHPLSDGVDNLRCAFAMASSQTPGVFVAFNRKIILGSRAVKVRTTSFDAFESVNMPCAATVDSNGLRVNTEVVKKPQGEFHLFTHLYKDVILIKLIPGLNPVIFDSIIQMKVKGLVIEAFGIGGLSYIRRDLASKLEECVKNGIAVVVCSQCLYEKSDFTKYEVGKKAIMTGVMEGKDMTSEAAVTKLMWSLGNSANLEEVREKMQHNYVNEITANE